MAEEQSKSSNVDQSLTDKVKDLLLDMSDGPSGGTRVLKVNLDMLNFHARKLRDEGETEKALQLLQKCIKLDREETPMLCM
jgi:hypothetical protein